MFGLSILKYFEKLNSAKAKFELYTKKVNIREP